MLSNAEEKNTSIETLFKNIVDALSGEDNKDKSSIENRFGYQFLPAASHLKKNNIFTLETFKLLILDIGYMKAAADIMVILNDHQLLDNQSIQILSLHTKRLAGILEFLKFLHQKQYCFISP